METIDFFGGGIGSYASMLVPEAAWTARVHLSLHPAYAPYLRDLSAESSK